MARNYEVVRGLVEPTEWYDSWTLGVIVVTDEDEEYRVDPSGKGKHLLDLIDEYVEIGGFVEDDDGELRMSVKRLRVVEEGEEEGYEGEED